MITIFCKVKDYYVATKRETLDDIYREITMLFNLYSQCENRDELYSNANFINQFITTDIAINKQFNNQCSFPKLGKADKEEYDMLLNRIQASFDSYIFSDVDITIDLTDD